MPNLIPVSRERHAAQSWRRYQSYRFAASTPAVPIVLAEVPRIAAALPIALVADGERVAPVAVMTADGQRNVFVAPDDRWTASYIPAALRSHPFALRMTQDGQSVLCVDEESGLLAAAGEAEAFFDEAGAPSAALKDVVTFLQQIETARASTLAVGAALLEHGLLAPFNPPAQHGSALPWAQSLRQVDEAKLDQLPDEAWLDLRRRGALPLVFAQLLSLQHWSTIVGHAAALRRHEDMLKARTQAIFAMPEDGDMQIDWSQFKA